LKSNSFATTEIQSGAAQAAQTTLSVHCVIIVFRIAYNQNYLRNSEVNLWLEFS